MGEEDKKFDAVLGGFLVNGVRTRAGHLVFCPEPEVLAAYHERSLLPEEMNSWKEHIVGCARCQAVLAEVEATDSLPLQTAAREEAKVMDTAAPATVAAKDQIAALSRLPAKARSPRPIRGPRWLWLAPAGALATGLLVWVAWHEEKGQLPGPSEIKIAKVQEPSAAPPPVGRQAPPSSSSTPSSSSPSFDQLASGRLADLSKAPGAVGGIASAGKPVAREDLKQMLKFDSQAMAPPAKRSRVIDKESGTRREAERDSSPTANPEQNQPALDSKAAVAGAMAESVQVQEQATNAQMQSQAPNVQAQVISPKAPGPTSLSQAEASNKKKADSGAKHLRLAAPPAAPPPPEASAGFADEVATQAAAISNAHLIAAPGTNTVWRAGRGGLIEFSTDNGASWSRQTSGVFADLTTGSAPSDKVCWIVGPAGTILLTTDAGSHWAVLHSPLDEDLGGVHAVDALHATIWNLRNTKTFETADGGATWKPVSNP
jgi:hypothetical protein